MLPLLNDFKKKVSKMQNVSLDAKPPAYWNSVGNYAVNKILSGSYFNGVPQGRITAFVGPSDCVSEDTEIEIYEFKTNPSVLKFNNID